MKEFGTDNFLVWEFRDISRVKSQILLPGVASYGKVFPEWPINQNPGVEAPQLKETSFFS